MDLITRLYIRVREAASGSYCGQTYTEYALIFVCVIIALIGGYQLMGKTIDNSVNELTNQVSAA